MGSMGKRRWIVEYLDKVLIDLKAIFKDHARSDGRPDFTFG